MTSPLDSNLDLIRAGICLHWLAPRGKNPVTPEWSTVPAATEQQLRDTYRSGYNIGMRPGAWSKTQWGHVTSIDFDVRKPEKAAEAWAELLRLFPMARSLPSVISGSGGESRHLYFLTESPYASMKLAKSEGFEMVFDAQKGREVKKYDWEIDLGGTGKNMVLPPSIHPNTGKPYVWERPIDFSFPSLMVVPAPILESLGIRISDGSPIDEDDLEYILAYSPSEVYGADEVEEWLDDLPEWWVDDYGQMIKVGQALHHNFQGSDEGFTVWVEWAEQSSKHMSESEYSKKWQSFKNRTMNPVTFGTVKKAAKETRAKDFLLTIDDDGFDDPPATGLSDLLSDVPPAASATMLIDLLSDEKVVSTPAPIHVPAVSEIPKPDPEWTSLMALNDEGVPTSNLHNVALIVGNDIRLYASKEFNEFTSQVVKRRTPNRITKKRDSAKTPANLDGPHWKVRDPINGDPYSDTLINDIRRCIEAPKTQGGYGIKVSDRDLHAAVDITARKNSFHPVRDRLVAFQATWDGKRGRVETLFTDYLKCPDTPYHRDAARLFLLGAVARIFQPGCKFDFVPIIEGAQGKGKTTFIQTLAMMPEWYRELQGDISDPKESVAALSGAWILEIGELSAMYRAEVNDLKAFVSRQVDVARMPYERTARSFPRQCVFIGSTNDREYLKDASGGRRYWPIECRVEGTDMIDNNRLRREIGQIWGEAVRLYLELAQGGDLRLFLENEDAAAEALLMQESRRAETSEEVLAGQIEAWLDIPMGDETGFDDLDPNPAKYLRDATCVAQIWVEMMGRQGAPQNSEAQRIGKALGILGWERSKGQTRSHALNKKYGRCLIYHRPLR